jgi:hypothetical protein
VFQPATTTYYHGVAGLLCRYMLWNACGVQNLKLCTVIPETGSVQTVIKIIYKIFIQVQGVPNMHRHIDKSISPWIKKKLWNYSKNCVKYRYDLIIFTTNFYKIDKKAIHIHSCRWNNVKICASFGVWVVPKL